MFDVAYYNCTIYRQILTHDTDSKIDINTYYVVTYRNRAWYNRRIGIRYSNRCVEPNKRAIRANAENDIPARAVVPEEGFVKQEWRRRRKSGRRRSGGREGQAVDAIRQS